MKEKMIDALKMVHPAIVPVALQSIVFLSLYYGIAQSEEITKIAMQGGFGWLAIMCTPGVISLLVASLLVAKNNNSWVIGAILLASILLNVNGVTGWSWQNVCIMMAIHLPAYGIYTLGDILPKMKA